MEKEKTRKKKKPTEARNGDPTVDKSAESFEVANPDVFYLIPRTVTLLYGPYMYLGMMDYRTERLQGMKTFLEKYGVTVKMTPCVDHVNLCRLWFLDELIFSCKITDLMHGGDGQLDPLCKQAVDKIEAYVNQILKGLRKQRPATPEQLKKPFCPCFLVNRGTTWSPESSGSSAVSEVSVDQEKSKPGLQESDETIKMLSNKKT